MMQKFWRTILFCAPGLAALFLVGCAATMQYPAFPDQTKTVDDPGKARIYLMRAKAFFNSAAGVQFFGSNPDTAVGPLVNSLSKMRLVGEVGPGSYICWEQSPGPFRFPKISGNPKTLETLNLEAGKVYYLKIHIHSGWMKVTVNVDVLDEKHGRAMLKHLQPPNDYRKK